MDNAGCSGQQANHNCCVIKYTSALHDTWTMQVAVGNKQITIAVLSNTRLPYMTRGQCRLRWAASNAQLLCYQKPFAYKGLSGLGRLSYTITNYGWCISLLFWISLAYLMIGWIIFQVAARSQ